MKPRSPDGITSTHIEDTAGANPFPTFFLVLFLGMGIAGVFGGRSAPVNIVRQNSTTLSVKMPQTIRNGMFFEAEIAVKADRRINELAIAVAAPLWREMTINTTMPSAAEETYESGRYRFSFGSLEAGQTYRFKIDGQINPSLFASTNGEIAVFDGKAQLARLPITMKVLP